MTETKPNPAITPVTDDEAESEQKGVDLVEAKAELERLRDLMVSWYNAKVAFLASLESSTRKPDDDFSALYDAEESAWRAILLEARAIRAAREAGK